MTEQTTIAPVRRSVTVAATPAEAFATFTTRMAAWWPLATHHLGEEPPIDVVVEPIAGGRWYERAAGGAEREWGRVLAYEPPGRILLAWHLDGTFAYDPDAERAADVEVTFAAVAGGTRVTLEHRGFERQNEGLRAAHAVAQEGGWSGILEGLVQLAGAA